MIKALGGIMDITKMVRDLACRLSKNETEILIIEEELLMKFVRNPDAHVTQKAKAFDRLKFINRQQDKLFGRVA